VVPRPVGELCTGRVLATELEEGLTVDGAEVRAMPQPRRDAIGAAALDLFCRELFQLKAVQTDPHFGNYRVRMAVDGDEIDRLVLYDFGAVRRFDEAFTTPYFKLLRASADRSREGIVAAATALGAMKPEDEDDVRDFLVGVCERLGEPMVGPGAAGVPAHLYREDGTYDWGASDLAIRSALDMRDAGPRLMMKMKLRTPPREMVFLNRKLLGVFLFLKELGAHVDGRAALDRYLPAA